MSQRSKVNAGVRLVSLPLASERERIRYGRGRNVKSCKKRPAAFRPLYVFPPEIVDPTAPRFLLARISAFR